MPPSPAVQTPSLSATDGIHQLPVLSDNIVWIWVRMHQAVVVDPAVAEPVIQWLQQRRLSLRAVLQTHHHADHIGGTLELLTQWPQADVIAAGADLQRIPFQTVAVAEGDHLTLLDQPVEVIEVPAHTRHHIAFYLPAGAQEGDSPALFCGDTLFGAGCGRLFEGSAADTHRALQKLGRLPDSTSVHCAHEYTEANLHWAAQQRPEDPNIGTRLQQVRALRLRGESSLPSSIGIEHRTNLFLQAQTPQALASLRQPKDHWKG